MKLTTEIKILKLIRYMKTGRRTRIELSQFLGTTRRSVYRYLAALEEAHVPIENGYLDSEKGKYKLYWIPRSWTL